MTALRTIPDIKCTHCKTLFRPKRSEQRFCSKDCWYSHASEGNRKKCAACDKEFKPKYSRQMYCSVPCKDKGATKNKTCVCAHCQKEFERPHGKARAYCSISCSNMARAKGMKTPVITLDARVIGDVSVSSSGYLLVRQNGKRVLQHRLIMEQLLGRKLIKGERVHHKNGDRQDNRPENLELWTGVNQSKKDPHGVRMVDKVLDLIERLKPCERERVAKRLEELR